MCNISITPISAQGTLWEGRYKATLIDSEQYALTCYRYIEMNPVRAEMVNHPAEYPWSSYRMNALGKHDNMVTPHPFYQALAETSEKRREMYRALFDQQLDGTSLKEIREATNKAWVLGSAYFKEKIEVRINRQMTPKQKGGDRKSEEYRQKINRV
ncbi:MAG: hypothetical protein QTN59_11990 [Candidatus Electrothrix communis]|nr:MAG: hypothetical protein QTN59_11990 [Candidatus Electrothrix communis]